MLSKKVSDFGQSLKAKRLVSNTLVLLILGLSLIPSLGPLFAQEEPVGLPNQDQLPTEATPIKPEENINNLVQNLKNSIYAVSDVKVNNVNNAKGIVVYLPQEHKDPTTSVDDPSNDNAIKVQQELYDVIKHLTKDGAVDLVMTEGELYGRVPEDRLSKLKIKMDASEKLEASLSELESLKSLDGLNPALLTNALNEAKLVKEKNKREIDLLEAPYKVKAEDESIILYGSENKGTYEKSASLVRKYVYLQDRLNQLQGGQNINSFNRQMPTAGPQIQDLLKQLKNSLTDQTTALDELKKQGELNGNDEIVDACEHANEAINELTQNDNVGGTPSRLDNPYQSVNNPYQLQVMLSQTEAEIGQVVIEDRNRETAVNFTDALLSENTDIGILQFGAGHTNGLIKELNQEGISVVTVLVKSLNS